jgi:6-pyruvoyl-tetrahydropterin synthase
MIYCRTCGHQQSLTLTFPFTESYRFIPDVNKEKRYKLDSIEISVTGSIKKDSSLITPQNKIEEIVNDNIISCYNNSMLIPEKDALTINEKLLETKNGLLNRYPLKKNPTLENLTVLFFNKLEPLFPEIGCQLTSIKLRSEGIKLKYNRFKLRDYHLRQ